MPYGFSLSDFEHMTPEERADAVRRLTDAPEDERQTTIAQVDARLRAFESRYEMSSERMRDRLSQGDLRETDDLLEWTFWYRIRQRHDQTIAEDE